MEIRKLVLLNWGIVQSGEYPFGRTNILAGETGIGKTTTQDAIQLIMTANLHAVARYNAAQEDASEKRGGRSSRRSPQEYALGAEEGAYARPESATAYVAVVFEASQTDRKPKRIFTAIAAVAASMDQASAKRRAAVLEALHFALVDDREVGADDFLTDPTQGETVSVQGLHNHLRKRFGDERVIYFRDHKNDYLSRLFSFLQGEHATSLHDAQEAAKTWSKMIAYRKIEGIDQLVRLEILEERAMADELGRVVGTLAELANVTEEAKRIAANESKLQSLVQEGDSVRRNMQEFLAVQYADPFRQSQALVREENTHAMVIEKLGEKRAEEQENKGNLERQQQALRGQQDQLYRQRADLPGAADKDRLLDQISNTKRSYAEARTRFLALQPALESRALLARDVDKHKSTELVLRQTADALANAYRKSKTKDLLAAIEDVRTVAFDSEPSVPHLKDAAPRVADLQKSQQVLDSAIQALYEGLADADGALQEQYRKWKDQKAKARQRQADLSKGKSNYPDNVALALDTLHRELAEAQPRVLCDLVEPMPGSEWLGVIEGFMGPARYNIVAAEGTASKATRTLRKYPQLRGVRIIQAARVWQDAKGARVHAESIVHELRTDHPLAKAYLEVMYGNVRKYNTMDELEIAARGVLKEGYAANSYTQYPCFTEEHERVFGKAARDLALKRYQRQETEADAELLRLDGELTWIRSIRARLLKILGAIDGEKAEHDLNAMIGALELETQHHAALERLDSKELDDIDNRLADKALELEAVHVKLRGADEALATIEAKVNAAQDSLGKARSKTGAAERRLREARDILELACRIDPEFTLEELIAVAEEEAVRMEAKDVSYQHRFSGALGLFTQAKQRFEEKHRDYNAATAGHPGESVPYDARGYDGNDYKTIVIAYGSLLQCIYASVSMLKRYREIEIEKNRERLERARGEFNTTFVTSFCLKVKANVDHGLDDINRLNNRLRNVTFGDDRFEIRPKSVDGYWKYYELFSAVDGLTDMLMREDLFATDALADKHRQTLESLTKLLLAKDRAAAEKELALIADYRVYRTYDVVRHTKSGQEMSIAEWGRRGSGGQIETAGYVLRLTVLANKLKHFERKNAHLRFILLDEAFQQVDEERTRALMRFIRDDMGMQMVVAMPLTKVNMFMDEFDTEFGFSRMDIPGNGEIDYATEIIVKDLQTDTIRTAWQDRRIEVEADVIARNNDRKARETVD